MRPFQQQEGFRSPLLDEMAARHREPLAAEGGQGGKVPRGDDVTLMDPPRRPQQPHA
jgi:hypothetical protein